MDEPNLLAASMQSVIDDVDICLDRIMARRSELFQELLGNDFAAALAESDGDSDSTIVVDHDYTTAQQNNSGVDETPGHPVGVAAVPVSDRESVILPEVLPQPRLLPPDVVIDLSNSFVSSSPNRPARGTLDVIEVSSDEDSPSTSRAEPPGRAAFANRLMQDMDILRQMANDFGFPTRMRRHQRNSARTRRTSRSPRASRSRRTGTSNQIDTLGSVDSNSNNTPTTSALSSRAPPTQSIPPPADTTFNGTEQSASVVCPICYESLFNRKLLSTVCGHMFCEPCLRTALKSNKKCPICKRAITNASHVHPIYLPVH